MSSLSTVFPPGYPQPFSSYGTLAPDNFPTPNDGDGTPPLPLVATLWNTVFLNHTLYQISTTYYYLSGLGIIPAAGPVGTNNPGVRFFAGTMRRVVVWEAISEDGTQPAIPQPEATHYEILIGGAFTFKSPDLDAGGETRGWEGKGWYVYESVVPRTVDDGYFAGAPVTDQITYPQTAYTRPNFVTGVLGPTPPPAAALTGYPQTGDEGIGLP